MDFDLNNYEVTVSVEDEESEMSGAEVEMISEEIAVDSSSIDGARISDAETSEVRSVADEEIQGDVIDVPLRPVSHPPLRNLAKEGELFSRWIFSHLYNHRNLQPEKIALIEEVGEARCVTYAELVDGVIKVANYMSHHGINNGDRIMMCMENSVEYVFYQLGAYLLGAVPILLSPSHISTEKFEAIECKAAVVDLEHYGHMLRVSQSMLKEIKHIFVLSEQLSAIYIPPHVWIYDGFGFLDFPKSFKKCMPMEDNDVIIFSSGGTVSQKAKFIAHKSKSAQLLCHLYYDRLFYLLVEKDPDYTSINGHHLITSGMHCHDAWSYLHYILVKGETCVLSESGMDVWRASFLDRIAGLIEQYKIPLIVTNAQLLKCFIKYEVHKIYDISSLKIVANTGTTVSTKTAKKVKNMLNVSLTQAYSAAEFGVISFELFDEAIEEDILSCGLPLYDMQIKVADLKTEKEVEHGEWGHIMLHGSCLFRGYVSEENKEQVKNWYRSEDFGMLNQKGKIYLGGPVAQLIEVKGNMASPELLENVINHHKTVEDAVVMMNGRELWCGVLLKEENNLPTTDQLDKVLKKHKINANVNKIVILDFIPRCENGKILRNEVPYLMNAEQAEDESVVVDNTESYV